MIREARLREELKEENVFTEKIDKDIHQGDGDVRLVKDGEDIVLLKFEFSEYDVREYIFAKGIWFNGFTT